MICQKKDRRCSTAGACREEIRRKERKRNDRLALFLLGIMDKITLVNVVFNEHRGGEEKNS